jgi:hypothetical protein
MGMGSLICMKKLPTHLTCRAPLHKECPKHHGHKGDPGVTPETCGTDGEKAQLSDPSVGEGPEHWECLSPTGTRSHEGKAMSYA